jgi:hypothetical protein
MPFFPKMNSKSDPVGAVTPTDPAFAVTELLEQMAIVGAHSLRSFAVLPGGVSSEIYRVDLPDGSLCLKRALPKLRVAADWRAPVERNHWEVEWMRVVREIVPAAVPAILGEDR